MLILLLKNLFLKFGGRLEYFLGKLLENTIKIVKDRKGIYGFTPNIKIDGGNENPNVRLDDLTHETYCILKINTGKVSVEEASLLAITRQNDATKKQQRRRKRWLPR